MRVATGTGQDAASVWRASSHQAARGSVRQRSNASGPISPAAAWSKGTYSHELVARALQSLGGPHSDQTGRRGGGALASVKVLALTVGAAALALVMAAGWAHPSAQLQLARPTARSKTQRNTAPQLPHGLPASSGMERESRRTSSAQPGHTQPGRQAAMPAPCRIGTGAQFISRCGRRTNSTPVAPLTAATW